MTRSADSPSLLPRPTQSKGHGPLALCAAAAWVALAMPLTVSQAWAREGVEVGKESTFTRLVPAEEVEAAAQQQYAKLVQDARNQRALLPDNHPQVVRLRAIAKRIIPYSLPWNRRAGQWQWQVVVLQSKELNAFCMPGGKIAFYTGILEQLKLTDDEVAMVMGHEVAHALREHARERMGKGAATRIGANLISGLLGLGGLGDSLLNMGGQLLTLKFSREDESEADLVGMELAARAGYDPRAGVSLWRKMSAASKGAPPQWMSTHPAGSTRISEIEQNLAKVLPLFERAPKPDVRYDGPLKTGSYTGTGTGVDSAEALAMAMAFWGRGTVSLGSSASH